MPENLSTDLWGQVWNSVVTQPFLFILQSLGMQPGGI